MQIIALRELCGTHGLLSPVQSPEHDCSERECPSPFKCTDDALTVPVGGWHRRYAGSEVQAVHWRMTPAQTPSRALALGTVTVHW